MNKSEKNSDKKTSERKGLKENQHYRIVQDAGINGSTFYSHCSSRDDVMKDMENARLIYEIAAKG